MKHLYLLLACILLSTCSHSEDTHRDQEPKGETQVTTETGIIEPGNPTLSGETESGTLAKDTPKSDDCDGDGFPDVLERGFGADPCKTDTDEDGLPDKYEIEQGFPYIDPAKKDTDADGIDDFYDDTDNDGVINGDEMRTGTSPLSKDFDSDGLADALEMQFGSDWKKADTDEDGLSDKIEYDWGLSPKYNDSMKEGTYPVAFRVVTSSGKSDQTDAWLYIRGIAKEVDNCRGGIVKSPNHVAWNAFTSIDYEVGTVCGSLFIAKIAISQSGVLAGYVPVFAYDFQNTEDLVKQGKISQEESLMRLFSIASSSKDRENSDGSIYEYDINDLIDRLAFTNNLTLFAQEEMKRLDTLFQR